MGPGKYAIELVDSSGQLLADLSGRAAGRKLILSRNEAEEIAWTIDLNEFERYARLTKIDPHLLLIPYSTEVRIRRGQKYLAGGQITYTNTTLMAGREVIEVRATGFLNLFKSRFTNVARVFTTTEATTIAQTLITETQTGTNRDFGVTIGPQQATVGNHNRTYQRKNIKEALQELTKLQTAGFDFEFTYDKKFNTYTQIGSNRPDIIFEYPKNIKQLGVPNDATGLANSVIALGSGFGAEAGVVVTANDTGSQANYKVREKVIMTNGTDNSDNGVTDAANSELAAWAFPNEIPVLQIDGNVSPFVTDYGIGDYVNVRALNHAFLNHIDAMYRIDKLELDVDEEDNEDVSLKVTR